MTDLEILKAAIEKAKDNEFEDIHCLVQQYEKMQNICVKERNPKDKKISELATDFIRFTYREFMAYRIIFSHDFAKALFGTIPCQYCGIGYEMEQHLSKCIYAGKSFIPMWKHCLQQMVLEKEPIKYLEQFLDEK